MTIKFTRILKMIEFQRLDISAELIPTYCALADYSNKKGYCWPKMETLAKTLKCSVRTIQRHIKELVEKGLIEIVKRRRIKGKLSSYLYKIVHIAQMASTGHGRQVERSSRFPRKSRKSRRNRKDGTRQDFNTPCSPPLSREEKRRLEDQKRKEGYEFLFGEPENPEAEEQKRKQREEADKKRYEGYEDLFDR
jgi:predicted transcriptional regulator